MACNLKSWMRQKYQTFTQYSFRLFTMMKIQGKSTTHLKNWNIPFFNISMVWGRFNGKKPELMSWVTPLMLHFTYNYGTNLCFSVFGLFFAFCGSECGCFFLGLPWSPPRCLLPFFHWKDSTAPLALIEFLVHLLTEWPQMEKTVG